MKIYVFALLVVATVAIAAFTNEDEEKKIVNFLSENEEELQLASAKEHRRVRRFTCDLLSGLGYNHSACAAHCILRGKTGGRCSSDGVCLCREKSIGK